ncbi:hypothetical protein CC85DRAFT_329266 [Cutaneotrichosporon oleaginosum]|uniref:Inositol hexakisphosphate-domain-containing protein n=1 Tax=Cutaneotrichosporon oleaginosum TaxID=879819 RepID=A0A0J0XJ94_9TREE|nr:uncharacterized protein CC85DRAFT_329266 [Cutaneotrichosporon oleaginosum]KLT41162.1 hypothetical protein CC85DRAFT_329266 [Cutaneotrichosporon oleaginosum]
MANLGPNGLQVQRTSSDLGSSPPTSPPSINAALQHVPARSSPLTGLPRPEHRRVSSGYLQPPLASRVQSRPRTLGRAQQLRSEVDGVVKRRAGSVLGRGFILKTDHYPTGRALDLDINIQGAPNFRAPHEEGLNVFGVAQPTVPGLKSILTILQCQPPRTTPTSSRAGTPLGRRRSSATPCEQGHTIWFSTREETLVYISGRPYVLRDAATPLQTLALSDRDDNLEDIERRLKIDILEESKRYGGLILCHDEVHGGELVPSWVAVDERSIKTPREIYDDIRSQGWKVDYWRIPVGPDRPIEDNYLDAYVSRLKDVDPLTTSLVFNCGMGVVRTTFAMCAALLVRRAQYLRRGLDDPFPLSTGSGFSTPASVPGTATPLSMNSLAPATPHAAQVLQQVSQQQYLNTSLLKVTRMLDENLPSRRSTAAIDLLSTHPRLLESLRSAHMGNYQIVLSLLSSLDHGRELKRLVDLIIDDCDSVVNLRENVIEYRIKYSVASRDDPNGSWYLDKAVRSLEQYFDLIVFAAYTESDQGMLSGVPFSAWLKSRPEIWNQIKVLRRRWGDRLFAFAPANDLSVVSRSLDLGDRRIVRKGHTDVEGGKVLGDEWAEHVVKNRSGIMLRASTLLKRDLWVADTAATTEGVRGAIGFRQVANESVYTTGQPTREAITTILGIVKQRSTGISKVVWICLREEPLVMINGAPYCLRRDTTALRNMRDYHGVSAARLEVLEERLKSDVEAELNTFGGTLLLHSEAADGKVVPLWENVNPEDVDSIRQVMDDVALREMDVNLVFERIPITSESSPDFHDITSLLEICTRIDLDQTAIILNDQLGRGRSSNTAAVILLIQRWIKRSQDSHAPSTPASRRNASRNRLALQPSSKTSWQIINSVLRVVRNGLEVKRIVDDAIDRTSATFNLRDAIEDCRNQAEEAKAPEDRTRAIERGMHCLLRYFHLIVFQAYLDDTDRDDENKYTFESFVKHRPVFKTLQNELLAGGLKSLTPLERTEPVEGMALEDEVSHVVANRTGAILSAQTILKSDFFTGLQKQSLPERVDGAANYRKVPLLLDPKLNVQAGDKEEYVYGTGMPSSIGLRNALHKMGAGPDGKRKVVWTSLREEPVLYVNGRPHVLRLVDKPLTNVETTGVTASVVERMELQLKADVIKEIREGTGKLLLHDEVETKPGMYEVVPVWETVEEENVMTPLELYQQVLDEGYHVNYLRIAITDEQAPLPAALQVIVTRVMMGVREGDDFVFNCQMGRGRTTTGMIAASLIATIAREDTSDEVYQSDEETEDEDDDVDLDEAAQYLNGEYKTILQLVTVLRNGKEAKHLTDRAINAMDGVQNLRKAVYDFKLKIAAAEPGTPKYNTLLHQGVNYLYRYGALIVLTNFLLECKEQGVEFDQANFPEWLQKHREIRNVLSRKKLD